MEVKVLITGSFSAGKTKFIDTLTGNSVQTEVRLSHKDEKLEKSTTTVAMDYGKVMLENKKIHLFGTPGQERFDFMLDILAKNKDVVLILVDSSNPNSIEDTKRFINFIKKSETPFIVACNKQDLNNSLTPEEVAQILDLPQEQVKPLVATNIESCKQALKKAVDLVESSLKTV